MFLNILFDSFILTYYVFRGITLAVNLSNSFHDYQTLLNRKSELKKLLSACPALINRISKLMKLFSDRKDQNNF